MKHSSAAVRAAAAAVLLAACSGASDEHALRATAEGGSLVVFAASSLTDVLSALGRRFEQETGTEVLLNLAGSQTLATQIVAGAPADLFIAADAHQMEVVSAAGLVVDRPSVVATNALAIVVERGNPQSVAGLVDLARADLVVVLPAEEVPAGRAARMALDAADVRVRPASLERSVRAALAKVVQGEADAAIVYRSDIAAAGERVDGVLIGGEDDVVNRYPAAVLVGATDPDVAAAFLELLRSDEGRATFRRAGFGAP
jgi:molybdate transport system substrate-binding protein